MSDGPHRSLPMRDGWKKLAERADRSAFAPEHIGDAVPDALTDDWRADRCTEFVKEIQNVIGKSGQGTFFPDTTEQTIAALNEIKPSGFSLRRIILDGVAQAVEDGLTGNAAIVKGAADALAIRCSSGTRQVEEHYLLKSNEHRAGNVRSRIEDGASRADFNTLARNLCNFDKSSGGDGRSSYDGLDDGVTF